ncbi:MAG: biotin-dependent carboxyltransferase family protein [Leadbetterella sp.]|nr:biotin-dependent carboxyltransferase family protein [Leadbetterella sp.]
MRFLKKGIWTTLQDGGRPGHAAIGVTRSGAMDVFSQRALNILLGHAGDHPVLEMHFPAPEIVFEEDCRFALYGADFGPYLNDRPLLNGRIYPARPGDILKFKRKHSGQRCYLGIRWYVAADSWLGSCSPDPAMKHPALPERITPETANSEVPFPKGTNRKQEQVPSCTANAEATFRKETDRKQELPPPCLTNTEALFREETNRKQLYPLNTETPARGLMPPPIPDTLRFVPEFDFETLDEASAEAIQTRPFTVTPESNRMGYRLRGKPLERSVATEMVSSAVSRGTIQLLPDGQLVILMADAQTTGGYPRLGYVCAADLSGLSRLGPGDTFSLKPVTEAEAVNSLLRQEEYLKILRKLLWTSTVI